MNNKQPTQLQKYIQSETIIANRITIINNTKTQLNYFIAYLLQDTTYQKGLLRLLANYAHGINCVNVSSQKKQKNGNVPMFPRRQTKRQNYF